MDGFKHYQFVTVLFITFFFAENRAPQVYTFSCLIIKIVKKKNSYKNFET